MQIQEGRAEFGKVIGFDGEAVFFSCLDREVTDIRERTHRPIGRLLLDLLESDRPGPGLNRRSPSGTTRGYGGASIAHLTRPASRDARARERGKITESSRPDR